MVSFDASARGSAFSGQALRLVADRELAGAAGSRLFPGVKEMFGEFRRRGTKTGILTRNCLAAITAVFPEARIQTCIVHLIRYSMEFASWKERKAVAAGLKAIYRAGTVEAAQSALEAFDVGPWGRKYPAIAAAWRRKWEQVIPFFAYPPEVRRIIYTTNAIESLHSQVRRSVRARGHFPTDEAASRSGGRFPGLQNQAGRGDGW